MEKVWAYFASIISLPLKTQKGHIFQIHFENLVGFLEVKITKL